MKLQSFIKCTAALLFFVALFPFGSISAQKSITIENPQEKLAGMDLKEGLNIVDDLPDGYHIGLVRKSGSPDQWVTVVPDGKTTRPITQALAKGGSKDNIMIMKCTYTKWGLVCKFVPF